MKMASISVSSFALCFFTILIVCTDLSFASNGDRSYIFGKCLQGCVVTNCTNMTDFSHHQPIYMKLLQWTCLDECKYQCMWTTVDAYKRDGSKVPQFYGKWPFVRYVGIQEPAAMVFSLLNALSHLAIFYYRSKVPPSSPMYTVWHMMSVVGFMTWLCAAVFHTRDTPITEKMDYFSAFGLVLFNLFTLTCRVAIPKYTGGVIFSAVLLSGLYFYHIYYLAFVRFDYGYNMMVNVAVGAINAVGWFIWCLFHYTTRKYCWKCVTAMLGLNLLLMLELFDFSPLLWTLDAHAIWHAGTVPLNILWYSFIIDDALHELKLSKLEPFKKML